MKKTLATVALRLRVEDLEPRGKWTKRDLRGARLDGENGQQIFQKGVKGILSLTVESRTFPRGILCHRTEGRPKKE